jgi:MoxR-like ATPase
MKEIPVSEKIKDSDIVDLAYKVITNNEPIELSQEIQDILINKLEKEPDNYQGDNYFFENSPTLKNFMAFLVACSLINQHICITGPAGVGKTSGARKFALLRKHKTKMAYQMHSFHAGTKPNHFYGTTSLENGKINYINGTLTNSLIKGCIFIADEMNLSPANTMEALAPALELYFDEPLYFPGITEPLKIKNSFFFIACQNDLNTIGRNIIPNSIASKFRYIPYPEQTEKDITDICKEIKNKIFYNKDSIFTDKDAENIGKFMLSYNKANIRELKPWSLRDITKLMNRIRYQEKNPDDFKNINPHLNVLFYCLSALNKEDQKIVDKVSEQIYELIKKSFGLDEILKVNRMKNCFNNKAIIKRDSLSGITYIMKNDCGVRFTSFEKKLSHGTELYTILESIFLISLSAEDEPIIIFGPSGKKTYLSKLFLIQPKVISLNPESTISQLLGSSAFFVESEAKRFYLDYLCKICGGKEGKKKFIELNQKLINNKLDKYDIETLIEDFNGPECFNYAVENLSKKLLSNSLVENCTLSDISLEFRPGLIFSSIIEGCPLILKNLPNLPTIVLERFNELLATQHSLTINEDIHNTFTDMNNKELYNFSDKFRIFGTSQSNEINKLSDAVLSRCSLVYASAYSLEEQETALKNFINNNNLKFSDNNIKYLIDIISILPKEKQFSFIQIINCIEICSRLNKKKENLTDELEKYHISIALYKILNGGLERLLTKNKRVNKQKELILKLFKENKYKEIIDNAFEKTKSFGLIGKVFQKFNPFSLKEEDLKELKNPEEKKKEKNYLNPFYLKEEGGKKKLISNITHLELESPLCKRNLNLEKKIAFVDYFNDMLDVLHFGFYCHIPIILEGKPGQGKQTAINYIASYLGFDIINIMLSSTTKVDDLLGREKITKENNKIKIDFVKTKFSNALTHKDEKDGRKKNNCFT